MVHQHWSCRPRALGTPGRTRAHAPVKMRLDSWLLCASLLHTWAVGARHAKQGKHVCPTEQRLDKRSKGQVQERVGHGTEPQHVPHHKIRPRRRKGSRVRAEEEVVPRILHHPSDVVVKVGYPATLSCRAEGKPKPTIEWLRNGQPLETDRRDGQSQPMALLDGSLFFLTVGGGKRSQSHEGVYTCMARNSAGKASSRNASLYIAVLREDFAVEPSDVEVAEGEVAELNCRPPVGHPEPNITWRKDGLPVNSTDSHYSKLGSKLVIAPSGKNHSGVYVCVASNTAGERESRAARLSVLAKPVLMLKPENVTVRPGESAHFYCQAKGDPAPAVVWSRGQGPLPNGRYLVSPNQSLQIHYVTVQDAGKYTCTAVNDIGVATASAQLVVEDANNTKQKDFHKELSAMRLVLENVTIMAPASNMSQVQWKLQSLPAQTLYLDGFEVLYRSLLPTSSDWAAKRVKQPNFQAQVGPLKRGYKYEFKVRPYGSDLYGRESNTRNLRVPEIAPSASPLVVSIKVDPEQNNTVHLSWEPPPEEAHNGIIQGYQIWCVDTKEKQYQNWTVDSGRHRLDISGLAPRRQYSITVAAVNGAGLGRQSKALGFAVGSEKLEAPQSKDLNNAPVQPQFPAVLRHPVLIGSACALLWFILMAAALCLYQRHTRTGLLGSSHCKARGLHRLAGEDLIIKHRMAAPDSPWISGAWRPMHCNERYRSLWAQSQEAAGIRGSSLPITAKTDPGYFDSAVPIVSDSCGVYGTFYVDLVGNGLKTFNSPGRCPKVPHVRPEQHDAETICISAGPVARVTAPAFQDVLSWKQAVPARPKMGLMRELNHSKQELHAVKSVPLLSTTNQACVSNNQRVSHLPPCRPGAYPVGSPRVLHYSTSLHLVDVLPSPPPLPIEETADVRSLTSDEGSSRSTKLTVDMGSLQSVSTVSGHPGPTGPQRNADTDFPSYSSLSTVSYCASSLDKEHGASLTSQEATQYLELSHKPETHSIPTEQPPAGPHSFPPDPGYVRGPRPPEPPEMDDCARGNHDRATRPMSWRRARLWSAPSSCYSEWDGSLWSAWGSVTEGSAASARTSLVSSVDGSSVSDGTFAHFMTLGGGSVSGASFSDFSPPASPLSYLYPPFCNEGDIMVEQAGAPAWEWNMAWLEEMEARYRAQYPGQEGSTPRRLMGTSQKP